LKIKISGVVIGWRHIEFTGLALAMKRFRHDLYRRIADKPGAAKRTVSGFKIKFIFNY